MKLLVCIFLFFATTFAYKEPISPIYTAGRLKRTRSLSSYDTCFLEAPQCDPEYKYRSFDGSCNNLDHPTWGMANSAFIRLFEPRYSDGIELPPVATDGSELPDARKIVTTIFTDEDVPDIVSLIVAQWAQFIAHDFATQVNKDLGTETCCESDNRLLCLPVIIPDDDPWFSQFNVTCQALTRTQTVLCGDCDTEGQKIPINGLTHGLDGSVAYGGSTEEADSLREHEGGLMTTRVIADGRHFLPTKPTGCYNSDVCYVAGESRVNQNTQLTIMHTLIVRAHNRVAGAFADLHPEWDDETLFQEARRFVTATYVHITYDEFLPHIIPQDVITKNGLRSKEKGYHKYDPEVPIQVIVSFANPTFRIFHSGLQGVLKMFDHDLQQTNAINLTDYVNSPGILEEGDNFDELILGVITQPMQTLDDFYTSQIEEKLFSFARPYGIDLNSLDIQRARDHGVPGYPTVLYGCTGRKVTDFDDLADLWPADKLEIVRGIYNSVDDIDLFVAINFENKVDGHRLTPVAECLVAEQFYRWKNGDRFWYEVEGQPQSFTPEQLDEIRKVTLSRLICDTSDNIVNIASNAWLPPGDDNPIVPCTDLPAPDLTKWL